MVEQLRKHPVLPGLLEYPKEQDMQSFLDLDSDFSLYVPIAQEEHDGEPVFSL
jgi:hypothetical protein